MKRQTLVIAVLLVLAAAFLGWRLLAPPFRAAPTLSGYIEGETLYLASPIAGTVAEIAVRRGDRVTAGARLFSIEPVQSAALSAQAAADLQATLAQAEDARKGQRPVEIGILEADRDAAAAAAREARILLDRTGQLVERGIYARVRLDEARAVYQTAAARLGAAQRRIDAAGLGQRDDQVRAADARVAQARARLAENRSRIDDTAPVAPAAGRVEEVFYQRGEWAAANQPVVGLIPDDRVLVRFFVPEPEVAAYRVGRRVRFACDGCTGNLSATISHVSPRPEFTPPVIYSREARRRLVFMVEARPEGETRLVPGLPVDVERIQ